MIEHYEEQLDLTKNRIKELEKNLIVMQEHMTTIAEELKQTQYFIMKLAKNQSELTKRISQWPYVSVPFRNEGDE